MKIQNSKFKIQNKGFTLIELLIVIALLGALAIGLLATVDPFEQLKKGRDTSTRNTVSEFYNAALRYYSIKGQFSWGTGGLNAFGYSSDTMALDDMGSDITEFMTTGELKQRFMDLAGTSNLAKIYVTSTDAEQLSVCYKPESKAFQEDANTQFSADASTDGAATCNSQVSGSGDNCYWCVQ
ncbi:MAG: hypothetical protein UT63_C0062G0005 [Candidatus Gottesmanbacteria bacterium GW2011_GWC2_39_8]|uniref:Uncharacterized protein n=1 Tax=Candidatus Gottesmanbacteria bacterium GW2011_GWC2_39_8 TaxID=1618450 RepID=A0A0G0PU92_9BACT|nr:MAG: hypothetical protein UT63_C0062G0005 [Candidatus Gottesmanbacteria bacterium GW2011_GWC2_39_8]